MATKKAVPPCPFKKGDYVFSRSGRNVRPIGHKFPSIKAKEVVKVRATEWDDDSGWELQFVNRKGLFVANRFKKHTLA